MPKGEKVIHYLTIEEGNKHHKCNRLSRLRIGKVTLDINKVTCQNCKIKLESEVSK